MPNNQSAVFRLLLSAIVLFLIVDDSLFGQTPNLNPNKKLSQYVLKSWSTEDGLSSESTNEMLQTDDGYIWIGTYTGLHRFDGNEFTVFTSQNSDLPSPNVLRIEKGLNGEIWIGTLHGISIYKSGEFTTPVGLEKTFDMSIEDMLVTKNGDLWFSTKSNQLFLYKESKLEEFTETLKLGKSTVLSILEDEEGNIYFGTDDSILISLSKTGEVNRITLNLEINGVNTLYHKDGIVYLGTGRGLYILDAGEVKKSSILTTATIHSLIADHDSVLWMGTSSGLYRWQPVTSRLDSLTEESGMPNNIVKDMIFDERGNLWVGTYRNGIFLLSDGSIISFSKNDGLASNIISGVTEIGDNTFLLANENGILNLLKNDEISLYTPNIPIPSTRLKHIFTDRQGRIWISTYGGLVVLDGSNSRHYTINNGFPDNSVRVAFQDREGSIWVGTKNSGLVKFKTLTDWEQITLKDGLTSNYILSIEQATNGDLIVGTISGLNIIRNNKVVKKVTVEDGIPSNFMFATLTTPNYIWIASNDGLTGYSEDRVVNFNTENGMPTNIVYDLMLDEKANLWMPSENSVLSIPIADLEKAASNPDQNIKVKQYDKSYGMKDSHCLGAVLSFTDSFGRFWIPTLGGIARIDPHAITPPMFDPKLIIENIYADGLSLSVSDRVTIPAGTNRVSIDYTGINYVQTHILQFRYRLAPFDKKWIVSSDRDGLYTNLPPGEYEFQLQAGIDDSFIKNTLTQTIEIEAAWWQTIWARFLFFVAAIGIALLIYWIRLRALTSRNIRLEEIVSERTKALEQQKRELNDAIVQLKNAQEQMVQSDKMASLGILAAGIAHEINNPLNFIQGGVDGLEQTLSHNKNIDQEEYTTLLGAIKEGISRASTIVSSLNEFSHSADLKREPCNIHHLINNCLNMTQFRFKHGIELIKEFADETIMVLGNNGKIHQAFLNIITNSIQAIEKTGHIKIKTAVEYGNVIIDFTDTGQGIKPENLSKITEPFFSTKDPGKGTGLGLSITYSIIAEHNGTLTYTSVWGEGTTARVTFPIIKS